MESKKCTKCKIEKDFSCFHKHKHGKYGLSSACIYCNKEYAKKYIEKNKEKIKERGREYHKKNKEKRNEYGKEYYKANKQKIIEHKKEYCKKNKEKIKERDREYYKANKQKKIEYAKKYIGKNKEKIKERDREYQKKIKEKRKNNPLYKLKGNLRSRTYIAFKNKGYSKKSKTKEMLGVDWETAKAHIQSQFTKGMNWDNQGEWHIDHIIPLSSAKTEQELIKLCHYRNLQPLWAKDNLEKSNKMPNQQIQFKI